MLNNSSPIIPVILSGGAGSRLWPLSRRLYPKQLLPLAGDNSMLQETVARGSGAAFTRPTIICNEEQRFLIAEQLRKAGVKNPTIVLEPVGRNTAPAAATAALLAVKSDPDALILLMPSDHVVGDLPAFEAAVAIAAKAAREGAIVTFGISPAAPETGYGYIQRGSAMKNIDGAFAVARFVEKPYRETAEAYLKAGDYFWNSGIFLFSAAGFLKEIEKLQ